MERLLKFLESQIPPFGNRGRYVTSRMATGVYLKGAPFIGTASRSTVLSRILKVFRVSVERTRAWTAMVDTRRRARRVAVCASRTH